MLPTPTAIPTQTPEPASPTPESVLSETQVLERQMVEAVNSERRANGLPPYDVDDQLTLVARHHSEDMVARGYFDHVTPEGITLRDRLQRAGITAQWVGENIQRNSQAGEEAVTYAMQWFMQSTPHRRNILHQHYTHIGVGVARGGNPRMTTFTLVFAGLAP